MEAVMVVERYHRHEFSRKIISTGLPLQQTQFSGESR